MYNYLWQLIVWQNVQLWWLSEHRFWDTILGWSIVSNINLRIVLWWWRWWRTRLRLDEWCWCSCWLRFELEWRLSCCNRLIDWSRLRFKWWQCWCYYALWNWGWWWLVRRQCWCNILVNWCRW